MSLGVNADLDVSGRARIHADRWALRFPLSVAFVGLLAVGIELVAVIGISVLAGALYHELLLGESGDIGASVGVGAAAFFYYAVVFAYRGNYATANLRSGWRQVREVTAVWILVCLFLLGIAFLLKIGPSFSRGATISFFALAWLFLIAWRWWLAKAVVAAIAGGAFAEQRVLVLGDAELLGSAAQFEELRQHGYRVAKSFPVAGACDAEAIAAAVEATRQDPLISAVLLVMDWRQVERIDEIVRGLSVVALPVRLLPDVVVAHFFNKPVVRVGPSWAAELKRRPLTLQERCAKRIFDVVAASFALFALSPLLVIVGLLIKADSRGPMLFRQTRAGFNNRPFRILKFRTLSTLEDGPTIRQVSRNDRRLTRLGRVLRRTSIDELPQLINVLRGEMSLVGPRPHAAAHNSEYGQLIANYAFRHHVKPGLTGWAQVNGLRGETTVDLMQRRVELDHWYIDNWSMWLDLKIIAWTLFSLLGQPAAY